MSEPTMTITKEEWDLISAWSEVASGYFEHDDEIAIADGIFLKATDAGFLEEE